MSPRFARTHALWLGVTLALSSVASAQTALRPTEPSAEELVHRGVLERQAGNDERALALFTEAYRRSASPIALAQTAAAEQALGRWILAEQHLRQALATAEHPYIRRNRALLEATYATISRHVGSLLLTSNVDGAQVLIDGALAGALPLAEPLRVLVGTHRLELRAPGYFPTVRSLEVIAGAPTREEALLNPEPPAVPVPVVPVPAPALVPAPVPVSAPPRQTVVHLERGPRALSWGLWGGGLALLGGAAASNALRQGAAVRYNGQCVGPQDASDACTALQREGSIEVALAVAGYLAAAGLAVAGAVEAARPRAATVRVTLVPGARGLTLFGSF